MPTFYISIDGPEGDRRVSLLDNLSENFGVKLTDALRVDTDLDFLVPMLEKLQAEDDMPAAAAREPAPKPKQRRSAPLPKICKQCGKEFVEGSVGGCCSKRCYNLNYRATHEITVSSRKKKTGPELPNQVKVDQNLTEEQARIDAVVAKASLTAPGATFEHHTTGPIMGRKI